ncbi:MAG: hypothetical protein H6739_07775 [Alphaproteobacteria bacterium]|nr:hypothetical protein [Alphaproteobacteria bacterium]
MNAVRMVPVSLLYGGSPSVFIINGGEWTVAADLVTENVVAIYEVHLQTDRGAAPALTEIVTAVRFNGEAIDAKTFLARPADAGPCRELAITLRATANVRYFLWCDAGVRDCSKNSTEQVAPRLPWAPSQRAWPLRCRWCGTEDHACLGEFERADGSHRLILSQVGGHIYDIPEPAHPEEAVIGKACGGCGCTTSDPCRGGCLRAGGRRRVDIPFMAPLFLPLCSSCADPSKRTR